MLNIFELFMSGEKFYVKAVTPVCEKYSITYMEFTILMFLANNEEFDTATDIVKYRHIAKSHVSTTVRSLEEKGLISCFQKDSDRRTVHLKIEKCAGNIVNDGKTAQNDFKDKIFENIDNDDIKVLFSSLKSMDENIKKYSQINEETENAK